MPPTSALTFIVFRDQLASRTFKISFRRIRLISWLLISLFIFGMGGIGVGIFFYLKSKPYNAQRVFSLESQVTSLRSQLETFEQNAENALHRPSDFKAESLPAIFGCFYGALPTPFRKVLNQVGLEINQPNLYWDNAQRLQLRFALQPSNGHEQSYQGKVVVFARGPGRLLSYPSQVISSQGHCLQAELGEPFSLTRFREVQASFGPFSRKADLQEIEILVLNRKHELQIFEKIGVPQV